jgi:hypothetical protein
MYRMTRKNRQQQGNAQPMTWCNGSIWPLCNGTVARGVSALPKVASGDSTVLSSNKMGPPKSGHVAGPRNEAGPAMFSMFGWFFYMEMRKELFVCPPSTSN